MAQSEVHPNEHPAQARPVGEIARAVLDDFQEFFRAEVRLAGAELKEILQSFAKAGGLLAAAALLGFFAMACLVTTCIVALAMILPLWLAALIIGVLLGAAAGAAFLLGRVALDDIDPVPHKTIQVLRETMERVAGRLK